MKMAMNGKNELQLKTKTYLSDDSFDLLFDKQVEFQKLVMEDEGEDIEILPQDSVKWFMYHVAAMTEELGEVVKADKRWKTHRNSRYEREEKLDEIADVFITAMNLSLFSDFSGDEVRMAIDRKIKENTVRIEEEMRRNGKRR